MNSSENKPVETENESDTPMERPDPVAATEARHARTEARRWWIKLVLQPLLLLAAVTLLFAGLGMVQYLGLNASDTGTTPAANQQAGAKSLRYICPMMCTPPQSEPGRCPVCAMELVPLTTETDSGDRESIQIDPVARRVADIRTVAVTSMAATRSIRAIGELSYNEGMLKTIAAYVDGRIERMDADYTGVVVRQGDPLALVYSPRLYSGQVEFLLAKKNDTISQSTTLKRLVPSGSSLEKSARQRLTEFGMTESQIAELERTGEANSRLQLCAPISGTVIEKLAAEGDYVKEGQPIYRLADLSTVWLMLELFPDDAATIGYGQQVEARVQSLPGQTFAGRVAFIDPNVDPATRTVGVRVAIPNPHGQLRVGDYAKATISAPLGQPADGSKLIYDPELAGQWISPRHPQIIRSSPGVCPICGVDLVPTSEFGFTSDADASTVSLMVPRDAVLMAGDNSVVYVEADPERQPGRFEIRRVTLGASSGEFIVVRDGLQEGEQVAIRGNFLIDSQMQLAGHPSLIDPTKLEPENDAIRSPDIDKALAQLSAEDRALAERQRICPVTKMLLGSMGTPLKLDIKGTPLFICCSGCQESLLKDPDKYLAALAAAVPENQTEADGDNLPPMDLPPIEMPVLEPVEPHQQPDKNRPDGSSTLQESDEEQLPPAETPTRSGNEVIR